MNYRLFIFLILFFLGSGVTWSQEIFSLIRIDLKEHSLSEISASGVSFDHVHVADEDSVFQCVLAPRDITILRNTDISYETLIEDYARQRQDQLVEQLSGAVHRSKNSTVVCTEYLRNHGYEGKTSFELGSMGGFKTYDEIMLELQVMSSLYPDLVSGVIPIGDFRTAEGRAIHKVILSDNPEREEGEPELLITGLHHAREPIGAAQALYTMWYLLENYGKDALVTDIVNNTRIVFVPVVNPDGYIYNQETNPNGGGLWRKNRRDNGDGSFGVDLNRNYGYQWGYDNRGSANDPTATNYRGPSPFSEPETRALKYLCEEHGFRIAINYHSFGDFLVRPWGYLPEVEMARDDISIYNSLLGEMTRANEFNTGTGTQTVGYVTNGDADDWMYGEQTGKNKIFSMSPELGHPYEGGFWPDIDFIQPQCAKALVMNMSALRFLLTDVEFESLTGKIVTEENFELLSRLRWHDTNPFFSGTIRFKDIVGNLSSVPSVQLVYPDAANIGLRSFSFSLEKNRTIGEEIQIEIIIDNNSRIVRDTVTLYYYPDYLRKDLIRDNATFLSRNQSTDSWGLTEREYFSPPSSLTDSPNGNYTPRQSTEITFDGPIRVPSDEQLVFLHYKLRYSLANNGINSDRPYDYLRALVSTDGTNFHAICAPSTLPCAIPGDHFGEPVYMGSKEDWILEEVDLSDYRGQNIWIKFELISNSGETADGVYLDDVFIDNFDIVSGTNGVHTPLEANLSVHPNPSSDYISVRLGGEWGDGAAPRSGIIEVRDILGHVMRRVSVDDLAAESYIDMSNLVSGMYTLTIQDAQRGWLLAKKICKAGK